MFLKEGGKGGAALPDGPQELEYLGLILQGVRAGHFFEKLRDLPLLLPAEGGEYLPLRAGEQAVVCLAVCQIGPGQRLVLRRQSPPSLSCSWRFLCQLFRISISCHRSRQRVI